MKGEFRVDNINNGSRVGIYVKVGRKPQKLKIEDYTVWRGPALCKSVFSLDGEREIRAISSDDAAVMCLGYVDEIRI